MVQDTAQKEKRNTAAAWMVPMLGVSIATLIATLTRPALASGGQLPQEVIIDGDVRQALATLLLQGEQVKEKLDTVNTNLVAIVEALGAPAPGGNGLPSRVLEPFLEQNQTLVSGERFVVYEKAPAKGSLVWVVIDVTDPDTDVTLKFDGLSWTFNINTLQSEGIDRPLFPGVWLSRFDAMTLHYAVVFSAGNINGVGFNNLINVLVTFKGAGTATLNEGRGICWLAV